MPVVTLLTWTYFILMLGAVHSHDIYLHGLMLLWAQEELHFYKCSISLFDLFFLGEIPGAQTRAQLSGCVMRLPSAASPMDRGYLSILKLAGVRFSMGPVVLLHCIRITPPFLTRFSTQGSRLDVIIGVRNFNAFHNYIWKNGSGLAQWYNAELQDQRFVSR
jgi:hypothetical protein